MVNKKLITFSIGLVVGLGLVFLFGMPTAHVQATVSADGSLVLAPGGTVYLVSQGTKRPFRSADVFYSYGYQFGQVVPAAADDLALPNGPVMFFRDGTLLKGPDDPQVYLVSSGQKRAFTSSAAFLGLGYSFDSIVTADPVTFADLPLGSIIDTSNIAHPSGSLIDDGGTVYLMTPTGKKGFSSAEAFLESGYSFDQVTPANLQDNYLPAVGTISAKNGPQIAASTSTSTVSVITPAGGEQWLLGSPQTISWTDSDSSNSMYNVYLVNQSGTQFSIGRTTGGITHMAWQVGNTMSSGIQPLGTYRISVAPTKLNSYGMFENGSAAQSNTFTVTTAQPSFIRVTSPNGGEQWTRGTTQTITWVEQNLPSGLLTSLGIISQSTGAEKDLTTYIKSTGQAQWPIPADFPSGSYKIVVSSCGFMTGSCYATDESDGPFTIGDVAVNTVATPTLSPAPGTFTSPVQVTLATATAGAQIYYTLDGTTPTTASLVYTAPFPLTTTTTVTAKASKAGMTDSNVVSGTYTITSVGNTANLTITKSGSGSGTVTSSPAGINCGATCSAVFNTGTTITLTAAAGSNSVFAGWSGANCSGTGTCSMTLNSSTSVMATFVSALQPDFVITTMDISPKLPNASNAIEINKEALVQFTVKNQGGASAQMPGFAISHIAGLSPANSSANISENTCLTLSQMGSNQTCVYALKVVYNQLSTGTVYGSVKLEINPLQAVAESDYSNNWGVINFDVRSANSVPTLTSLVPTSGPAGAQITVNGTDLALNGQTTTVKFGSTVAQFGLGTATSFQGVEVPDLPPGTYPVTMQVGPYLTNALNFTVTSSGQAATPTLNPAPGTYNQSVQVTLATATAGAQIYYTLDGTTPTTASLVYTAPFPLTTTTTVTAKASKAGMTDSNVVSGTYTIENLQRKLIITLKGSDQPIYSIPCGVTVTYKITNYSGSQAWLEQTKDSMASYNGLYQIPGDYTMRCLQDEGTFVNRVYTVVNGNQKGTLIDEGVWTVYSPVSHQPVITLAGSAAPISSSRCDQAVTFSVPNYSYPQVWIVKLSGDYFTGATLIYDGPYTLPTASYTPTCNQDEGKTTTDIYAYINGQKGVYLGTLTFTINPAQPQVPEFYQVNNDGTQTKLGSTISCGTKISFSITNYTRSQVWLRQYKAGSVTVGPHGPYGYDGPYNVPEPGYILKCNDDVGTYVNDVYYLLPGNQRGTYFGEIVTTVTPKVLGAFVEANAGPAAPSIIGPSTAPAEIAQRYRGYAFAPNNRLLTYILNWGDGTVPTVSYVDPGSMYFADHAWAAPGDYQLTVTALNDQGISGVNRLDIHIW